MQFLYENFKDTVSSTIHLQISLDRFFPELKFVLKALTVVNRMQRRLISFRKKNSAFFIHSTSSEKEGWFSFWLSQ
jgi:hypothetical protein